MDLIKLIFVESKIVSCLILVTAFLFLFAGAIRKSPKVFYILSGLISLGLAAVNIYWDLTGSKPEINSVLANNLMTYVQKGIIGYCMFIVVMFLGVVSKKGKIAKKLMAIRGETAIIASIFSLCHLVLFGFRYLRALVNGKTGDIGFTVLFISSALLLVIMFPLWVSSFKEIRKRMTPQKWKKIQAYSYYFYFILFANMIFVFVRRLMFMGDMLQNKLGAIEETYLSLVVYTAIFVLYTVLRVKKNASVRNLQAVKVEKSND